MKNIVLDTNCIMASISKKSDDYAIWRDFQLGKYNLCVTTEILEEYEEIIARTLTPEIARTVILYILNRPNVLKYQTVLNLSNLPPAAYVVRVSTNDFVINKNVIKN